LFNVHKTNKGDPTLLAPDRPCQFSTHHWIESRPYAGDVVVVVPDPTVLG
jgi:hypothetical protein